MKLTAFEAFELEGEPQDMAAFMFVFMEVMRKNEEMEKEKKIHREMELLEKLGNMTFGEMMKSEREEDKEDD